MARIYVDAVTLNPPPGQSSGGATTLYAVGEDPNGVLTASAGDFAWQVGTSIMWSCSGGSVWVNPSSSGSARGVATLTYQPGGTNDAENGIYTDWVALHAVAAAAAASGVVPLIVIDDSVTTPAVIPAGTYDMSRIELMGIVGFGDGQLETPLRISDGVVFTNWGGVTSHLQIEVQTTAPLFAPTGVWTFRPGRQTVYLQTGGSTVFQIAAGDFFIIADDYLGLGPGTIISTTAGNTTHILCGQISVAASAFSGAGNMEVETQSLNSSVSTNQPGIIGTFTVQAGFASHVDYAGSTPPFVAPAPTNVQDAIDRIAAVVEVLNAGNIP